MRSSLTYPRKTLGVLFLAVALALAPAALSLADDHDLDDDTGVECFLDDDWALFVEPGDEVDCEAWGLVPDEAFDWDVEYVDADSDVLISDDFGDGVADADGVGEFSFTIPADIDTIAYFEGWVVQDDYEEPFFGVILVLSDVTCAPDPVVAGNSVDCEISGLEPGEWFYWIVELTDGTDPFDDLDDLDLDNLDDLFDPIDEGDIHAEGEGEADGDGIGHFSFDVPEDTDAVEYVAVALTEVSFGVYVGEIEAAADDTTAEPVDEPVEEQEDDPVVVERPTRVDTGAGGTAGTGNLGTVLGGLLVLAMAGALAVRRRAEVR